jgi:DNA-binding SARP family transcriptional activator/EAL domain-containing protein (putative c-di-GMP-specific phosphodiesterase class I)
VKVRGVLGISLLGRLSIESAGKPVSAAFSGRRSELVFAYLVTERHRDVSRDELADALWPQELPDAWSAALRSVVSDVRRVIGATGVNPGELLEHTGGGYRLQLPPDTVVDVEEAGSTLEAARATADQDPVGAAAHATRAAELARLPFLPRHEGNWIDGVRRGLENIHVDALEVAARAHARANNARAATAAAARLVEAEPFSDSAYRVQIEVLAGVGDRAGAMRAFERCRARFVEELGVEPSAQTREALERALETVADAEPPQRPSPAPIASRFADLSVLVVEHHEFQRRTTLALLERLGVRSLTEATDAGAAAERLAASVPPDVIICDVDMPGMDGVEFIRHVAQRRLASAVLVASTLDHSVLQAVEAVGSGYGLQVLGAVEKPLTARRLSELLAGYRRSAPPGDRIDEVALTEAEIRAALDDGRIGARLVPIVDIQADAFSGVEVLATWQDEAGGSPRPYRAPIDPDLAAQLTDRVLGLACDQLDEVSAAGPEPELWIAVAEPTLADNVTGVDRLLGVVREHGADPRRIVLGVGERAVRFSSPAELDVLTRLRVKGFGVCLDDVGAGYAGDDGRSRVPLTAVALAPALVRGAAREPAQAIEVEDTLESVRAQGLQTLARGCDEPAAYELLLQAGCRHAQGEIIAGALAPGELAAWARDWRSPVNPGVV